MTPTRDQRTTKNRGGPQKGRPNARVPARTNVTATLRHDSDVAVDVSVLQAAADLIADCGDLERQAYERGVLHGFGLGWEQRGEYEAERGRAA